MPEFKKILIAVKDSANSIHTAKAGFALAQRLDAMVALIYVVDKSREAVNADLGITPRQSSAVLLREAETTIRQLIELYKGAGQVFHFTPEGSPEKEIAKIAREWEAGLIVMGASEQKGLNRLLSASKAAYVIRHVSVPVMIVPPMAS